MSITIGRVVPQSPLERMRSVAHIGNRGAFEQVPATQERRATKDAYNNANMVGAGYTTTANLLQTIRQRILAATAVLAERTRLQGDVDEAVEELRKQVDPANLGTERTKISQIEIRTASTVELAEAVKAVDAALEQVKTTPVAPLPATEAPGAIPAAHFEILQRDQEAFDTRMRQRTGPNVSTETVNLEAVRSQAMIAAALFNQLNPVERTRISTLL